MLQIGFDFRLFPQNTLLHHFIHRGGRKRKAGLKAGLNTGELVRTHPDDLVNGFLTGANHPDLAGTFAAQLFGKGLQIQQHIRVCTHILANFVDHKQKTKILRFSGNISLDVLNQPGNGELNGSFILEPVLRIRLAHIQHFHQSRNDEFSVERKRFPLFHPGLSLFLFKHTAEILCFSLLRDILLQHGNFQIIPVESQMGIKHLGKNPQNRSLILVDGAFNVNIKQDGLRLARGGFADHHKSCRVIGKLFPEQFNGRCAVHIPVFQNIGQHFQEVGFTTAKKTGNPHTNICSRLRKSFAIEVKEPNKMFFQLLGDYIFPDFLLNHFRSILVYLDHTVDWAVNVVRKHITNDHACFLLQ